MHNHEYIWLGSLVGDRKLTNVALKSDAAVVTDDDPYSTLSALKKICGGIHGTWGINSVWPSIMTLS